MTTTKTTYRAELQRRLEGYAAAETSAWSRLTEGAAKNWWLAPVLESAENLLRQSLKAHHASIARAQMQKDAADPDTGHLARWVEDQTDRLLRGTFLQRSTSLFARARGEAEHEVVGELVNEIRALLPLIASEQRGGAR